MPQTLKLHPDSVCAAVARIEVDVVRVRGGIVFSYTVTGSIGALHLPLAVPSVRADELWQHTCFEAFVRAVPGEAYDEFNFAPSTQWAAYRFDRYRNGMHPIAEVDAPRIELQTAPKRYVLRAMLALGHPFAAPASGGGEAPPRLRVGLAAVIEETNGRKSYWALAHPPGKPDFHHADCFALELSNA
jgi:hypothetical protein